MKLPKIIKLLTVSDFFKHSAALLSSNVLAQAVGFLIYPFITRCYGKELFGEFNWFLTVASLLTLFATGKYELAILLPKSEKKALALFRLSSSLTCVVTLIIGIAVFLLKDRIALFSNHPSLTSLLPLLPFFVLAGGLWQSVNYYFMRQKKYYRISLYNISQSIIGSALKVIMGIKGFLNSGLILSSFIGQAASLVIVLFKSGFTRNKHYNIDRNTVAEVAKTYSNFPKYELPNEFINNLAGNLPVLLLSFYFDMAEIGVFSLALTVGFRPVNIFCGSMYQVLFGKISEKFNRQESIKIWITRFATVCLATILPCFAVFLFIAKPVFGCLFGVEWANAGIYFRYMLPWLFLIVLTASVSFIPDLFFKQKTAMMIEVVYILVRLIALLTGVYLNNFELAIALFCGVSTVMLTVKLLWYLNLVNKYEKSVINISTDDNS